MMWRSYWPKTDDLIRDSEMHLKESLYQEDFKLLIKWLSTMDKRKDPQQIAEEYQAKRSIPIESTLQFLIDIGLSQRIKR